MLHFRTSYLQLLLRALLVDGTVAAPVCVQILKDRLLLDITEGSHNCH